MSIDVTQFLQVFFEEAEELLAEMEKLLLAADVAAPDMDGINAIFRAAHSIKGGAATFGLADLAEVTHMLESLLDPIRKGTMALTGTHVDTFLAAKDVLSMQLAGHRYQDPVDGAAVRDALGRLEALAQLETAAPVPAIPAPARSAPEGSVRQGRRLRLALPPTPQRHLDALVGGRGLMGTAGQPTLEGGRHVLVLDTADSVDDILAVCSFVLDPGQLKIAEEGLIPAVAAPVAQAQAHAASDLAREHAEKTVPAHESASIRVGIDKVDQLINLVGELVITQAMIMQRTGALDPMQHESLLGSVSQLSRNTRDLQEAVMAIRMIPMDYVFSRFPRMVRDLAAKLGKKVDFVTHGAATELDKGLIERIIDPLTHLVRNSIDHGLELPAARVAAGKGESGTLALSAEHRGGNIVIEVADDGGGLDREKILAKARQQGMAVADGMPDAEVWRLIFAPGFSTAEAVTDVSGRGVGMDVVKRNIAALGGAVDIQSARGQGTTITISLPLTLAILDGMSVKVGEEIYIVPLGYVVESLQPAAADLKEIAGSAKVLKVRGEYLPLIRLHEAFGIEARCADPSRGIVVILETDGRKAALLVDELVAQQQVVVKNLEANYRKVPGISGATILGDGGVALILDVSGLLRFGGTIAGAAQAA